MLKRALPLAALAFAVIFSAGPLRAEETALPVDAGRLLETAAQRDAALQDETGSAFLSTLSLLLESYPDKAQELLQAARRINPDQAEAIANLAGPGSGVDSAPVPPVATDPAVAAAPAPADEEPTSPPTGFIGFDNWAGQMSFGGSLKSGTLDEKNVVIGIDLKNERRLWRHRLKTRIDWTRTEGVTTERDLLTSYQVNRKFNERLSAFAFVEYRDELDSGFKWRMIENIGLAYILIDNGTHFLEVQGGPAVRHEKPLIGGLDTNFGGRVGSLYRWTVNSWLELVQENGAYFGSDAKTVDSSIALKAKLTERWAAQAAFTVNYDSAVPPPEEDTDTETTLSILYSF